MKERGLLFSAPMVRAVLVGKKTQTRRLYKPRYPAPYEFIEDGVPYQTDEYGDFYRREEPYGVAGDRLWVRETWATDRLLDTVKPSHLDNAETVFYLADGAAVGKEKVVKGKTRTGIFMPRWASRLVLEVTDIRVERLRAISEADCRAEGFSSDPIDGTLNGKPAKLAFFDPLSWFAALWDGINLDRAPWKSDPFVWVVSFRKLETPR